MDIWIFDLVELQQKWTDYETTYFWLLYIVKQSVLSNTLSLYERMFESVLSNTLSLYERMFVLICSLFHINLIFNKPIPVLHDRFWKYPRMITKGKLYFIQYIYKYRSLKIIWFQLHYKSYMFFVVFAVTDVLGLSA